MELTQKQRDRRHELAMKTCFYGGCAPVINDEHECSGIHETCTRHNKYFKAAMSDASFRISFPADSNTKDYIVRLEARVSELNQELCLQAYQQDRADEENALLQMDLDAAREEIARLKAYVEGKVTVVENMIDNQKTAAEQREKLTEALEKMVQKYLDEQEAHGKLAVEFLKHLRAHGKI